VYQPAARKDATESLKRSSDAMGLNVNGNGNGSGSGNGKKVAKTTGTDRPSAADKKLQMLGKSDQHGLDLLVSYVEDCGGTKAMVQNWR